MQTFASQAAVPRSAGLRSAWCRRIAATVVLLTAVTLGAAEWLITPSYAGARRRAPAKQVARDAGASFQTFCKAWMEKVWARQQRVAQWEPAGDGVQGTYVEYGRDYQCTLTDTTPPVGKIHYRETWYEKRGKTVAEAEASEPQPIKIFDTGEYFSFSKGKWAP